MPSWLPSIVALMTVSSGASPINTSGTSKETWDVLMEIFVVSAWSTIRGESSSSGASVSFTCVQNWKPAIEPRTPFQSWKTSAWYELVSKEEPKHYSSDRHTHYANVRVPDVVILRVKSSADESDGEDQQTEEEHNHRRVSRDLISQVRHGPPLTHNAPGAKTPPVRFKPCKILNACIQKGMLAYYLLNTVFSHYFHKKKLNNKWYNLILQSLWFLKSSKYTLKVYNNISIK